MLITTTAGVREPIWPAPPDPKALTLPIFCPKPHRAHIIELYRCHGNAHPEIPVDEHGTRLTAEEHHRRATKELYQYCFEHDLSQVWAYLWNQWYCASQWVLWARAASPAIPRLKTTMVVESLWKQIKRRDLPQFNRPRLDLVTFTISRNVLPRARQKIEFMLGM